MEEMSPDEAIEEQDARPEQEETAAEVLDDAEVLEPVEEEADKIAALEQQAADNLDKYQRCLAEFDNFRKRTAKEKPQCMTMACGIP